MGLRRVSLFPRREISSQLNRANQRLTAVLVPCSQANWHNKGLNQRTAQ